MKFLKMMLILTIALSAINIQLQPIDAQSSSKVDSALKERLMKQYGLLPASSEKQPSLLDLSQGNFGFSFEESDSVFSFLPTALLRVYFRLI